jgi:hypothetical protein
MAGGGPLLLAGEIGDQGAPGRRVVILPFDLSASDLPLQIAFPVLMANISGWLRPGQFVQTPPGGVQAGAPVRLLLPADATSVSVLEPDGSTWKLDVADHLQAPDNGPALQFAETSALGIYLVTIQRSDPVVRQPDVLGTAIPETTFAPGAPSTGSPQGGVADGQALARVGFAVNMFSAEESHIQPAPAIRLGGQEVTDTATDRPGQRELWPILLVAGLLILGVEWWVQHRGLSFSWARQT